MSDTARSGNYTRIGEHGTPLLSCDIAYSESPAASRACIQFGVVRRSRPDCPLRTPEGVHRVRRSQSHLPRVLPVRGPQRKPEAGGPVGPSGLQATPSGISGSFEKVLEAPRTIVVPAPQHPRIKECPTRASGTRAEQGPDHSVARIVAHVSRRFPCSRPSIVSKYRRTIAPFSCVIAYSRSPAASRASASLLWQSIRVIFRPVASDGVLRSSLNGPLPHLVNARGNASPSPASTRRSTSCVESLKTRPSSCASSDPRETAIAARMRNVG